jgi:hypothetical protein
MCPNVTAVSATHQLLDFFDQQALIRVFFGYRIKSQSKVHERVGIVILRKDFAGAPNQFCYLV